MVILGGWMFLITEVPLYPPSIWQTSKAVPRRACPHHDLSGSDPYPEETFHKGLELSLEAVKGTGLPRS